MNYAVENRNSVPQQLILLTVFAAVLILVLLQVAQQPQRQWQDQSLSISLDDRHYRLSQPQWLWLQQFSALHFSAEKEESRALLEAEVNRQLDLVFAQAEARLPEFADWYYSIRGEYSRISMYLLSKMRLVEGDYLADRAAEIMFPTGLWEVNMQQAQERVAAVLLENQQQARVEWLAEITQRLAPYQVPAPLAGSASNTDESGSLDDLLGHILVQEQQTAMKVRMSLSAMTAMGVAGRTLWRTASARTAVNAGRAAGTRVASRGAARAGTAALSGGAVCSPAGPLAVGCAVVAGAAAWVASDWLLLQLDEALNREELLQTMRSSLQELQTLTAQELLTSYDGLVAAWYDSIDTEISNTFVPAQTL